MTTALLMLLIGFVAGVTATLAVRRTRRPDLTGPRRGQSNRQDTPQRRAAFHQQRAAAAGSPTERLDRAWSYYRASLKRVGQSVADLDRDRTAEQLHTAAERLTLSRASANQLAARRAAKARRRHDRLPASRPNQGR